MCCLHLQRKHQSLFLSAYLAERLGHSATQQNNWRKELEPEQPVHSPWVEQTKENDFDWTPPEDDSYAGFPGAPLVGPTTYVQGIVMQTQDLETIFLQYYCTHSSPR